MLQIEQILHHRGTGERMQLMEACLSSAPTLNNEDGMVLLDRNGRVVCHRNAPSIEIDGDSERLMRTGDRLFSPKADMTESEIAASLSAKMKSQVIKSIMVDGRVRGTVLVFENKPRSRPKVLAKPPVRPAINMNHVVPPPLVLGESKEIRRMIDMVGRVSAGRGSALIEGETGVEKELFGRLFYSHMALTPETPFVTVNCGAITKDLFGGELFGHVPGAFTGALREGKKGKFEQAHGGVLCLDEIGEMPLDVQPFLLRALEEKVVYRLGDSKPRPADVRLVALTNRDLLKEVEAGTFRKDLYYRIGAIKVPVPTLRERGGDVSILLDHFNRTFAEELGRDPLRFTETAMEALLHYSWPGNVGELRNLVESLHLTSSEGTVGRPELINSGVIFEETAREENGRRAYCSPAKDNGLAEMECLTIKKAIEDNNGNLTLAAKQMGIARSTMYRKMDLCGIKRVLTAVSD